MENNETMLIQEESENIQPTDSAPAPKKKGLRPEWILGFIVILMAAVLITLVVVCMPYFHPVEEVEETIPPVTLGEEDPAALLQQNREEFLEPTEATGETEPETPTIPPDPNPYDRYDFQYNRDNYLVLQRLPSSPGIDVSAYQGNIDWKKVADSGIEFAIIRLGYRGYGKAGRMVEDAYAKKNLEGARKAGLKVGAYFFSQALNQREVDEEITFMLKILGDFPLDMPIILDWEIPTDTARTVNMDARTLTDIQRHFCQTMTKKGYTPMIYFNWFQSERLYYLSELEEWPFWLAMYQDRMTYPWEVEMWQYTCTGKVPGIQGDVDINVYMGRL